MYIYLQPIGEIPNNILDHLSKALEERFGVSVKARPRIDIPEEAYNKARGQYHSTPILDSLKVNIPEDADKVLGIIDKDLYVPELNFVFGEADLSFGVALISLSRLKQEFYGLSKDDRIFFKRAVKEAVHELGHTYGFRHCRNSKCVMFFSNSLADTDRKGADFCEDCRRKSKS